MASSLASQAKMEHRQETRKDTTTQWVELVDVAGDSVGKATKLESHSEGGLLHRAVSVLLFDHDGRVLLQRRAHDKYHFGGRWANTCCSHPYDGETPSEAADRALREEMGVECLLREVGTFVYRATDEASGLTEWEYDHVFVGQSTCPVSPNPDEVGDILWLPPDEAIVLARHEDAAPWLFEVLRVAGVE